MLRYPVLLVHGLGMPSHDLANSSLWGRIPERLRAEGASVWFSTQDVLGGVESCARQTADSFRLACERAGAEKMHVVAHSKGGLDMRVAMASEEDVARRTASLVTLATPHNGLHFVDRLNRSRVIMPHVVAPALESRARREGDETPSGVQVLEDLSTDGARRLAERFPVVDSIPCVSFGFVPPPARGSRRLNVGCAAVSYCDGVHDGLVPLWSTEFGRWVIVLVEGVRNFTHIDSIDRHCYDARFVLSDGREFPSIPALVIDELETLESAQA